MAAALAVELLVALRHHPAGLHAPADSAPPGATFPTGGTQQPLGLVPHQVRRPACPACALNRSPVLTLPAFLSPPLGAWPA